MIRTEELKCSKYNPWFESHLKIIIVKLFCVCLTGSCSSRKGLNGACSVHEYAGFFMNQSVRFKMTSVCGHVMSLDFTGKRLVSSLNRF